MVTREKYMYTPEPLVAMSTWEKSATTRRDPQRPCFRVAKTGAALLGAFVRRPVPIRIHELCTSACVPPDWSPSIGLSLESSTEGKLPTRAYIENEMDNFRNVLCVVDTGKGCGPALERAVALTEKNGATLTVVNVAERVLSGIGMPDGMVSADLQAAMVSAEKQNLDILIRPYRTRIEITTKVVVGVPFLEIVREVLRNGHDLVIKIPENPSWLNQLLGSDDMHLLRKCPCPVWLIKPRASASYRRILAAVDVDDAYPPGELEPRRALNRRILEIARSLALSDQGELHIVHAWEAMGETVTHRAFGNTSEEKLLAYIEQVRARLEANMDRLIREVTNNPSQGTVAAPKPRTHLLKGWARQAIPALATQIKADLLVMGTVGRTGVAGLFMGNTAETILNQIDCSVLAIKPPGFVTPIKVEG